MNQVKSSNLYDSRVNSEIKSKLKLLTEVTFNLKCATFKIVDLPVQTIRQKLNIYESSLLTTLDSIFHDLKRIQTLLTQHSVKYTYRENQNATFNQKFYSDKNLTSQHRISFFPQSIQQIIPEYNFHRQISQVTFHSDIKRNNLKKTKKVKHLLSQSYMNKSEHSQIKQSSKIDQEGYHHLQNLYQIHPKMSHDNFKISKVLSKQYVGMMQNHPVINIKKQPENQKVLRHISPPHSQLSYHSKGTVDWKSIHLEEHLKDKENEQFLKSIQEKRQFCMRSISRKKQKCLDTIERINSNMINERERSLSQSQNRARERRKSKTEKFKKTRNEKQKTCGQNQQYNENVFYDAS